MSTKVFIGNIALATANNFRVVLGRDYSSPNSVGEVRSRTLHHTKAWFVTGSFLYPPAFFSIRFLFFFSTWKSKLKNPNHPEVNRRRITSQHFHRVIIVSHSFRCQKLKLFLIDGEKLWSIAEAWALSKLRLKKYLYCYAGTYFCFLYDHRTSEETTSELRRRCNAFFMELVSIFCFGDSVSKDLEKEATALLMRYVIGHQSTQTKDFSPFPDYAIDPTPVVRSFLLQQLLRSR